MKLFSKLTAVGAVLVLGTAFAAADTITLGSFGTLNGNGGVAPGGSPSNTAVTFGGAPTYNIGSGSAWTAAPAGSSWVSFDPNSGPTGGNVDPNGTYTYTTTFTAAGGSYSGNLIVMADDTTNVVLNGLQLIPSGTLGGSPHCAVGTPNCVTAMSFALTNINVLSGLNTVTFNVQQTALVYQGLDFSGSITQTSAVPEPGTLMLLGTGLIGSAGTLMRRMRRA